MVVGIYKYSDALFHVTLFVGFHSWRTIDFGAYDSVSLASLMDRGHGSRSVFFSGSLLVLVNGCPTNEINIHRSFEQRKMLRF